MLFFVLGGTPLNSLAAEKNVFVKLDFFSIECIKKRKRSSCQRALALSEQLQRQAAAAGIYSCQSRLLGLGADLVMTSFKFERSSSALALLREVKKFCSSL